MSLFRELEMAESIIWDNAEIVEKAFGWSDWDLIKVSFSTQSLRFNFLTKDGQHVVTSVSWEELREKLPRVYAKILVAPFTTMG